MWRALLALLLVHLIGGSFKVPSYREVSGTGEIVREVNSDSPVNSAGQKAHYSRPAKAAGRLARPQDPAACRPVRGGMEKRVDHHGAQRRGRDAGQRQSRGEASISR